LYNKTDKDRIEKTATSQFLLIIKYLFLRLPCFL